MPPDSDAPSLEELLLELRNVVTPVIGYLELVMGAGTDPLPAQMTQPLARAEARLADLSAVATALTRRCRELRGDAEPADGPAGLRSA